MASKAGMGLLQQPTSEGGMGTGTDRVEIEVRRIGDYARIEENPRGHTARRAVMIPFAYIERVASELLGIKSLDDAEKFQIGLKLAEDWNRE